MPTRVSYSYGQNGDTKEQGGKDICSTGSWHTSRSLIASSPFIPPSIHPSVCLSVHPSVLDHSVAGLARGRRPLSCQGVKEKMRQNSLSFRCLRVNAPFQPFRKVLWLSSSSPASSQAKPRTPLWSSQGLSVGAAMHTVSVAP